ncbi:MAG: hypothetical protein F4Z05_06060 [Chloroflexi bacterium]|nr:hypothetical protein [Chloroflexota bacterium]
MDSATLEIGQLSSEEGITMAESEQYPESSRSLDSLREMRLTALLGDLIGEQGKTQAAETLGVSPRTLTRYEESRRLTPTLTGALERHLLEGGGSAAATQRHRLGMLEDRLTELERLLREGLAADERQAKALDELAQRVAALEAAGNGKAQANAVTPAGVPASASAPSVSRPRRVYPDLVTAEAEPSEELVYGDVASPVIVQWRQARDLFAAATDAMDILNARERRLKLEVELIEQHELTLPPATRPWDWGDRRQEVRRRNEMLYEVNVDRKMLKLKRFLTLGLWRK